MKIISKLVVICMALMALPAWAQKDPDVGFVRLINAVAPGQGNTKFSLNGEDLFADGYEMGQATGGLGLKAGSWTLVAKREGVEPGMTNIDVKAGETMTFIAFGEKIPPKKEGDPPRWTIKILRLKQSDPEKGYRMAVISVCDLPELTLTAEVAAKGRTESILAKRLGVTLVDLGRAQTDVIIKTQDTPLTTVSTDRPGNYVVLIYQDSSGKIGAINFFDPKFMIAG